jgi:hypothetical protein
VSPTSPGVHLGVMLDETTTLCLHRPLLAAVSHLADAWTGAEPTYASLPSHFRIVNLSPHPLRLRQVGTREEWGVAPGGGERGYSWRRGTGDHGLVFARDSEARAPHDGPDDGVPRPA